MFKLIVDYKNARLTKWETLTSGSVGPELQFEFSPEWKGLIKTVCFENGRDRLPSAHLRGDRLRIPREAMRTAGTCLRAGVYGETADGRLVIPTVYAALGRVCQGAEKTGRPPQPPTPDWTAAIEAGVSKAVETAEEVKRRADAGAFNGRDGAGLDISGARPGQIAAIKTVDAQGRPTAWEPENMGGGAEFKTDATLSLTGGILGVNTARAVEKDSVLPVSSAAVYAELGNIHALLRTI